MIGKEFPLDFATHSHNPTMSAFSEVLWSKTTNLLAIFHNSLIQISVPIHHFGLARVSFERRMHLFLNPCVLPAKSPTSIRKIFLPRWVSYTSHVIDSFPQKVFSWCVFVCGGSLTKLCFTVAIVKRSLTETTDIRWHPDSLENLPASSSCPHQTHIRCLCLPRAQ